MRANWKYLLLVFARARVDAWLGVAAEKVPSPLVQVAALKPLPRVIWVTAIRADEFVEATTLGEPHLVLQVFLKYGPDGEKVIRHIERYSKPGRRVYQGYKQVRRVLDGLGIAILSTSKGVMSDRKAKAEKVGGEILCTVW